MKGKSEELPDLPDHLSKLPANIAALVSRYGEAREALGMSLGADPMMSHGRLRDFHERVARAERRLVEGLLAQPASRGQ